MEGGEHTHPRGAVGSQLLRQLAVYRPGVVRVGKAGLRGKGVGVEPVQQGQIHAHAQHGVLGGVEVQIRKGLDDQRVPAVLHGGPGILLRQHGIHAGDDAVFRNKVSVFRYVQPAQRRRGDDIAFENGGHRHSFQNKRAPAQRALIARPWAIL